MGNRMSRQAIAWFISAALCCCAALSMLLLDPAGGLRGWLTAWVFFGSIPIGGLFLAMMMEIIPGAWRQQLYPSYLNMPLLFAVLLAALLPLFFGYHVLHEEAEVWEQNGFKAVYLHEPFVVSRAVLFLLISGFVAIRLRRRDGKWVAEEGPRGRRPVAIIGLLILTPLQSMIVIDWIESLEPKFHSSGFGLYLLSIQMTIAMNALVMSHLIDRRDAYRREQGVSTLGRLMLVALLFWAYLSFMQYFIIWSENLPDEVAWYLVRGKGFWSIAEYGIGVTQLVPLVMLFFPPVRSSHRCLLFLAGTILLGKMLELAWLIFPGADIGLLPSILSVLFASGGLGCLVFGVNRLAVEPGTSRHHELQPGASS